MTPKFNKIITRSNYASAECAPVITHFLGARVLKEIEANPKGVNFRRLNSLIISKQANISLKGSENRYAKMSIIENEIYDYKAQY